MRAPDAEAPSGRALDLRLRRDARKELEWFFDIAETEMTAPSNFGRMLASVSGEGYTRTPEDQAEAARAHRKILEWLRAMPNNEAGVLQAAYEFRDWPRLVRARFGQLTRVAVRLTCSLEEWPEDRRQQEAMDRARARDLAEKCDSVTYETFLGQLRERAEERLERAIAAYVAVRGTGRSVIPERAWGAL